MADTKNYHTLDGTLYAKNTRQVQGVKDPSQTYEFKSIVLEVKTVKKVKTKEGQYIDKTFSELPEFDLGYGIDCDSYAIGDAITVKFAVEGREYKSRGGEKKIMTKLRALFVSFTDINRTPPKTKDEEIFVAPNPLIDDIPDNDLPF